jgi:hypothetical protein
VDDDSEELSPQEVYEAMHADPDEEEEDPQSSSGGEASGAGEEEDSDHGSDQGLTV